MTEGSLLDLSNVSSTRMHPNCQQLNQFTEALTINASLYDVHLTADSIRRLSDYYQLLNTWNPRLHLVAPCSADEFARRHILESLLLVPHLPQAAKVVDVGSGAGLPIIPCLITRPDLSAVMIESSHKKALFLREVLNLPGNASSAQVIAERFEQVATPAAGFVTSRALDRFVEILPRLVDWSPRPSKLLLFGGDELRKSLNAQQLSFEERHIPNSEKRFLFVVKRS